MTTTTEVAPAVVPQEAERTINEDMAALAQIIRTRGHVTHEMVHPYTGAVCIVGAIAILRRWAWYGSYGGDDFHVKAESDPITVAIKTKLGWERPLWVWNDAYPDDVLPVIEELAGISHE